MDSIKQYFIPSMENNVNETVDGNDEIDVNMICIEPQQKVENEITQSRFMSINELHVENSNAHFIRKIQRLEEENDRLLSIIEQKNVIINEIPKSSCNEKSHFAAKKILLLTDRVQELMLELQSIKSSTCGDDKRNKDSTIKIKELTDKLYQSNKNNFHYRNQIMQLKNDLQVTQNALSNEIGDSTIMQAVLSSTGSSNFRGRAQHILILQKKVNELQEKLNKFRGESNDSIKQDAENSNVIIRELEKARKEITNKAFKDIQSKVNELTKSVNVWKNRSNALEVEITVLRVKIQKLLSKAEVDSKTIEQLK
ncbi:uncharacterized protein LOC112681165, partial [Sipha flava]|uniref:Uncharacterized protein LOC112681165 n=1 Tax=Sipha flava TaxID=143950 RepID=A0A8B8F9Z9_9HEMI